MKLNKDKFNELYKEIDKKILSKQGKEFLDGNLVQRVNNTKSRLWNLAWIIILMTSCSVAGFYLWVLYEAKQSGTKFSELRNESIRIFLGDNDD